MPHIPSTIRWFGLFGAAIAAVVVAAASAEQPATGYDLIIANGRVMDPESGLDAVRHVGIRGGTIATISETPLAGARIIDAARHVVAPGFVDLHEHGQQDESYRMMVRDGVTSAFELEVGTANVAAWYAAREGGQIVNYGVSIGHIPARMKVLEDPGKGLLPAGIGGSGAANDAQMAAMELLLREGLAQGAVAMGLGSAYTPGAPMSEIERMFRVAAEGGVSAHIHMRGGLAGLRETIKAAAAAGARLHIVHVNSSAGNQIDGFLAAIQAARDAGQDVTTEAYPYGAGMTEIQSAPFDDWATWPDERFAQHQLVATGERLTRQTFAAARKAGGTVITHGRPEQQTRAAIVSPLAMIASDGFIENGRGHPRTSGTYAKVLGRYVRDEGVVTLMNALGRMTLEPARRLERRTPAMAKKGRVRVGADADLTIFDPATVIDRATYEDASIPSAGIPYVVVGGQVVVDRGQLTKARPGRAVRAPLKGRTARLYNPFMISRRDVLAQFAMAGMVARFAPSGFVFAQAPGAAQRFGKEKLLVRSLRPPDFETPVALLDSYITPIENFYVRSHLPVPAQLDAAAWTLKVGGEVNSPVSLSIDEIKKLPAVTITMTLECAGNGRAFFDPSVAGIQWEKGAVGTARFTGARMADVLKRVGVKTTARNVEMHAADRPLGTMPAFVRQVPMAKAMHPDTLLAYDMNGQPIPAVHGFPLRAIVPGWEGAYSVKWLTALNVLDKDSDSFWVATGYRYPTKHVAPGAAVDAKDMAPLVGLAVKSLITKPTAGASFPAGKVAVGGFAWAGENDVTKVDVSIDNGATWQAARLTGEQAKYSWRRFEYEFAAAKPESVLILSRATDSKGNIQPAVSQWNPSGYLWNQYDSVRVEVKGA